MATYYTRAKARSDMESEELEQCDSAPVATTSTTSPVPVGLYVEFMRESESMSTEIAGPVATHPQLLPEGGHPSVGGRGVFGSADSLLVGVSTLGYPSGPADPLDSVVASVTDAQSSADLVQTTSTTTTTPATSRQPPTDTTAAAFQSPTLVSHPAKNRRLSWPIYCSGCHDKHNHSQWDSNAGLLALLDH